MTEPTASSSELVVREPNQPTVAFVAALESAGAVVDRGLELPLDLSYDRYESLGLMLAHAQDDTLWMIGDWLNFGFHIYGQKYAQAADILGYHPQTLTNIAYIARQVKPKQRSRYLKFYVHEPLAKLGPAQQRALLKRAEEEGLSKADLRKIVKGEPEEDRYQDVSREVCPECLRPL